MSEVETASFQSSFNRLLLEAESPGPNVYGRPTQLPLEAIKRAPEVFQPRSDSFSAASSEQHVHVLTNAIFAASGRGLEPITIWWSGKSWYLIDGHHRVEAYTRANKSKIKGWTGKVPVVVFSGTLLEAVIEATRLNAKDKLPMQPEDKLNRAWLFVVMDEGMSRQKIATVCTVGTNTVSRMRRRLKELQELREVDPEDYPEDFSTWTWKDAREDSRVVKNYDDDWQEREAQKWARRLSRTFGSKLVSQPEVFLKALEIHSPRLVEWLQEYLQVDPDPDF